MKTVSILIGNSDDKLTQKRWREYVMQCSGAIDSAATKIHFSSGSVSHAEWQNFCWVIEVEENEMRLLFTSLKALRRMFNQDSVAVVVSETKFI